MDQIDALYKDKRKQYISMMSGILQGDRAAAEDVVQEAFTRAIKFWKSYDEKRGKLATWFNRILFNSLRDVQKEMRGHPPSHDMDFSVQDVFTNSNLSDNPEFFNFVSESVGNVDNDYHKRILELFFLLGYTSTEISQIEEGATVSNVTTVVNRFRKQISVKLKWHNTTPVR